VEQTVGGILSAETERLRADVERLQGPSWWLPRSFRRRRRPSDLGAAPPSRGPRELTTAATAGDREDDISVRGFLRELRWMAPTVALTVLAVHMLRDDPPPLGLTLFLAVFLLVGLTPALSLWASAKVGVHVDDQQLTVGPAARLPGASAGVHPGGAQPGQPVRILGDPLDRPPGGRGRGDTPEQLGLMRKTQAEHSNRSQHTDAACDTIPQHQENARSPARLPGNLVVRSTSRRPTITARGRKAMASTKVEIRSPGPRWETSLRMPADALITFVLKSPWQSQPR